MVYVLDHHGTPMMPTTRYGKVRRMLNNGKAKVVKRIPFTIQLNYETKTHYIQPITLGVDPHRSKVGMSAITKFKFKCKPREVYASEIIPRQDVGVITKKTRQLRQSRRYRNKNRKSHKRISGLNARKKPVYSLTSKVFAAETINSVIQVTKILPITKVNIEVSEVPSPKIYYEPYIDFIDEHILELDINRTHVLNRDHHTCQWCYGKSKDKILTARHVDEWFTAPDDVLSFSYHYNNDLVVTLCKQCRDKFDKIEQDYINNRNDKDIKRKYKRVKKYIISNHKEFICNNPEKRGWIKFKLFKNIKNFSYLFGIEEVNKFYGQYTAAIRHKLKLENNPINNARIIAVMYPYDIEPMDMHYYYKFRKHHDRSLHKVTPKKGGIRNERSPKIVKGFKSYDRVTYLGDKYKEYYGKEFYITKKRKSGYFGLGRADGTTIINSVKSTSLKLKEKSKTYSVDIIKDNLNTFYNSKSIYNRGKSKFYSIVGV